VTRAGFVALVGRPNAGKSTLLNRLVGEHLAITSPKPQSTRQRVVGIRTDDTTQIVFLDTPGLLEPGDALDAAMRAATHRALADADVVGHLQEAGETDWRDVWTDAGWTGSVPPTPVVRIRTKADLLGADERAALQARDPEAVLVSARTGDGLDALLDRLRAALPVGPFLFPDDDVSTQNLRFFAAEFVREAALEELADEVPHALACVVEEFRESRAPVYIRAVLYVERESQKRIVIGKGGERVREIGRRARARIEALVGQPVYLDLWVKVLRNWRRNPAALRRLGFPGEGTATP
jgi:GTP-binding protein Era